MELDIFFTGLLVKPFKMVKYDCNRWNVKAMLEYYGCTCADYILGKQLGFYFDEKTLSLCPWHMSLDQDIRLCHNISMVRNTIQKTENLLAKVRARLENREPTLLYGWTYPLMEAEGGIAAEPFIHDDILHMTIISGYDANNDTFLLTELKDVHLSSRFMNWYSSEVLMKALASQKLAFPNTWFEFHFSDNSFEIDSEACLRFIKWNHNKINNENIDSGVCCGLKAIRRFSYELTKLCSLAPETKRQLILSWYWQLLPVLQQRLAHYDFMRIASSIVGFNFDDIDELLKTTIKHWILARKFCYKFGRKHDRRYAEKVKALLERIAEEELKLFRLLCK
ncbi:MAG: hypothetical protein JRE28_04265 [Deltaproteobacteria bacterium]|nr:hypothetical protein [Deltaproteobacteria bacterium]